MNRIALHSLWIGHAADGRDSAGICEREIEAVVQLAVDEPIPTLPREIIVLRIPLIDGSGNPADNLELAISSLTLLLQSKRNTLVCCSAGASRSPAVAACAMSRFTGQSLHDCLTEIHQHHPTDVAPGFWNELLSLSPK